MGLWFVFQLISGLGMLGGMESGVAYGAHIGGFVAGAALAKPFMIGRPGDRREETWRRDRHIRRPFSH